MSDIILNLSEPSEGNDFMHYLLTVKNAIQKGAKKRLFLLLDNSGSMGGMRIDLVKHACKAIISSSNENIEICIFTFSTNSVKLTNLEIMNVNNKRIFIDKISSLCATNSTNLLGGLQSILDYIKSIPNPSLIDTHCLVFTDGEPDDKTCGKYESLLNSYYADTVNFNCIIDVFGIQKA